MPVFTRICPPALPTLSHHKGTQRNCLSNPQTLLTLILILYCIHRSGYNYSSLVWATLPIFLMNWSDKYLDPRSDCGVNDSILLALECCYHAILRSLQPPAPSPWLTSHYLLTAAHNPGGGQRNVQIMARGWSGLWPQARLMSQYCGACCDNPTPTTTIWSSSPSPGLTWSQGGPGDLETGESIKYWNLTLFLALSHWYDSENTSIKHVTDRRSQEQSHNIQLSGWHPSGPQPGKCWENILLLCWECFDWLEMKIWSLPAEFNSM